MQQTKPSKTAPPLHEYQPIHISPPPINRGGHRPSRLWIWLLLSVIVAYFLIPLRTNILILGSDDSPQRGVLGRTDTIIMTTISPYYTGMLSIPRDLWVTIPGVGENRINVAYFFAEAAHKGGGADAAMQTVRSNFGVTVNHYVLLHMGAVAAVVDAMGGVNITLEAPMGGLDTGNHSLDGSQALAFARERYSSDDFSRMKQGQIIIMALIRKALNPLNWTRLPAVVMALSNAVDTDVPAWLWPRLMVAVARAALFGMDGRTITREMVMPFTTEGGAQVLAPDWTQINPLLFDIFRE